MKNNEYWKKRSEDIASKQFKNIDDYLLGLELEYQEALYSIQKYIEVFYARFAQNNEITLAESRRLLNSNELQEFKMSLKEFITKAKNNLDGKWEHELNNVFYKVRITRLQALQVQIRNQIELLHFKQQKGTTNLLRGIYEDTYYKNIYELYKGLGAANDFARIDTGAIEKVISEPWQGSNYSSRIWNNKEKLLMELQTNLTQAFIRGDSIDKISKTIAERMNVASSRARTLVNTESAYITSKATFDSYESSGVVKEYEILATLDLHTSKICRSMDGRVFKISEKEIGVNAPPFHPNCRTTTVAYFDDIIEEERIARDGEGKNYPVKGNINYEDWYDKYVNGKYDNGLNNNNKDIKIASSILKHANVGEFTNPKNPKKDSIGRFKSGGHGQDNIKLLEKYKIEYNIIKEYSNGVRIGNVPSHKMPSKRTETGQSWFPEKWTQEDIKKAGQYVANLKDITNYILDPKYIDGKAAAIFKYANYDNVTVGICYDVKKKNVTTIFPDETQRMLGGEKNDRQK